MPQPANTHAGQKYVAPVNAHTPIRNALMTA